MDIKSKLLKLAGKDNFSLDESIGFFYFARLCCKYGWMLVRGKVLSFFCKGFSKTVFIGRKVKLYEKKNIVIGNKTKIHMGTYIDALSTDGVIIGSRCILGENNIIECTGSLSSIGRGISIGDGTTFGSNCFFGAAGGIHIGENVLGGQYIRFHSENHNFEDLNKLIKEQGVTHKGIIVGNNCWIGSGVVFLDGATIGNGCVVAANAVVTGRFDDNVVIGGIPAKVIKNRGANNE